MRLTARASRTTHVLVLIAGLVCATGRDAAAQATTSTATDTIQAPGPQPTPADALRLVVEAARADSLAGARADSLAAVSGRSGPTWALVFAGGIARGLAHIGVVRALEERGLVPNYVVGTSMGGLVAALYASGYTSDQMKAVCREVDWDAVFGRTDDASRWRGTVYPRPWLGFEGSGLRLRMPSGLIEDQYLNFALSAILLPGDARAQGDFDSLRVPLRVVATDLHTLQPYVLKQGSVARAARMTAGMAPAFAPMPEGRALLVDGGTTSNLPISIGRALGVDHILAVDVALPNPALSESSSVVTIGLVMLDLLNKRGQSDTLMAGDKLVWMRLPGISAGNFYDSDRAADAGYDESRQAVWAWADSVGLARDSARVEGTHTPTSLSLMTLESNTGVTSAIGPNPLLPPLEANVPFAQHDGRPSRRVRQAEKVLGRLPQGPVRVDTVRQVLADLYRADLFTSAWPSLRIGPDSTRLGFDVKERPASDLSVAAGYDNDLQGRLNSTLSFRPTHGKWPALVRVGGTLAKFQQQAYFSFEPYSLARRANGWFLRGTGRRSDTRLFNAARDVQRDRTDRVEVMAGGQIRLPWNVLLKAGAGGGRARSTVRDQSGFMAALDVDSPGRVRKALEAVAMTGPDGYSAVNAVVGVQIPMWVLALRPSLFGGYSSARTASDELQGLGGPATLSGLRDREWLGRSGAGVDLRAVWAPSNTLEFYVTGQTGFLVDVVSRVDLGEEAHGAIGLGMRMDIPFGPFELSWGRLDHGEDRFDVRLGQKF